MTSKAVFLAVKGKFAGVFVRSTPQLALERLLACVRVQVVTQGLLRDKLPHALETLVGSQFEMLDFYVPLEVVLSAHNRSAA